MSTDRLKAAFESGVPGCNWIVRFDEDGHAEAGSAADLDQIDNPGPGHVWLHLDCIDRRFIDVLRHLKTLTAEAREALAGDANHQFVEHADHTICGAIVDHQHAIDGPKEDTDFLRFACGPGFLITARRIPIYSAQATRRALADGVKANSPIALFELIVTNLCKCSASMMRDISVSLDRIEDNVVIEGRGRDQRAGLGHARRSAVRLARQVNGLQSTLERLEEASEAFDHKDFAEVATSLGQRADSLARDAANLQDRARMLHDEINAILTTETNDRLYTLTVITALILPATFVTGFFGMNTKNLIFAESESGTIYASFICLAASLGALLMLWRMGLAGTDAEGRAKPAPKARKRLG
ncbi:CorA family divalent cation transporter [Rhodoblastus sp. 17X3]|uniref:CorA family divalent cation transporter n=1 Tax=Rhodoblastus sp. 17X3 TaxID=3047026 RepID=UPI0024B7658C|nr:CorA family divalent cation transporter [Rhodoblastus sp. 17X3]MDI9849750.1 CorA family divalent cation transporter [Rhodoblastus sp. 17X3]